MIEVRVILPGGKRGKGRIDPSAPFQEIKEDIVNAFSLGDPNDFNISISPKSKKQSPQNYRLSPGDVIILSKTRSLRGPAFEKTSPD